MLLFLNIPWMVDGFLKDRQRCRDATDATHTHRLQSVGVGTLWCDTPTVVYPCLSMFVLWSSYVFGILCIWVWTSSDFLSWTKADAPTFPGWCGSGEPGRLRPGTHFAARCWNLVKEVWKWLNGRRQRDQTGEKTEEFVANVFFFN